MPGHYGRFPPATRNVSVQVSSATCAAARAAKNAPPSSGVRTKRTDEVLRDRPARSNGLLPSARNKKSETKNSLRAKALTNRMRFHYLHALAEPFEGPNCIHQTFRGTSHGCQSRRTGSRCPCGSRRASRPAGRAPGTPVGASAVFTNGSPRHTNVPLRATLFERLAARGETLCGYTRAAARAPRRLRPRQSHRRREGVRLLRVHRLQA
jgi:hypothetical protein